MILYVVAAFQLVLVGVVAWAAYSAGYAKGQMDKAEQIFAIADRIFREHEAMK